VEVRSPVRTDDGDGMISCVVQDCDELTQAACQSLVILNDGGWIGIAVNGGKVVEKEVKISGDGDWSVTVLEWMRRRRMWNVVSWTFLRLFHHSGQAVFEGRPHLLQHLSGIEWCL